MPFIIYTSNSLERLADSLAGIVQRPLDSPMRRETIVVMSPGMKRWLSLRLAGTLAVCANCDFLFPNVFIDRVFRNMVSEPSDDAFNREVMSWRIMGLLPQCVREPLFEELSLYLGDDSDLLRRWQLACKIAYVFDQYIMYRPAMIMDWERGGEGGWQAELWRRLSEGAKDAHFAAVCEAFLKQAGNASYAERSQLPPRIFVFGISSLPPAYIDVLRAVAGFCELHLFFLNPSRHYWGDITSSPEQSRIIKKFAKGGASPGDLHLDTGNSLLASMGRLGRDFFDILMNQEPLPEVVELWPDDAPVQGRRLTLLECIQRDILNLVDRGAGEGGDNRERIDISPGDTSVTIHSCHSAMREIEVLYDYLLDLFNSDSGLEPHDVLIMTPDVKTYAPYFQAVFGSPQDERLSIPFSIADRSIRAENRIFDAFFALLDMAGSRFGAAQVLDLLQYPELRNRFLISAGDVETLAGWIRETRIRWGIDGADKEALDVRLPAFCENTWRHGVDRMLLGYALPGGNERMFHGILPFDEIEGGASALCGNFSEFFDALVVLSKLLQEKRAPGDWAEFLLGVCDDFFAADDSGEAHIDDIKQKILLFAERAGLAAFDESLDLPVVRSWLERNISDERVSGAFLSGGVTFCEMLPMRSIPFRMICLIGMNDAAFPRASSAVGFDIIARKPRPGDRSARDDDRYIFLETLISARERLYISYTGQSIEDSSSISPSVLVSELLDYIEQGYRPECAEHENETPPFRDMLVTRHRLQAFSGEYFGGGRLYSYSETNRHAAAAMLGERRPYRPFITGTLPGTVASDGVLDLNDIISYFCNPPKHLLTRVFGIYLDDGEGMEDDREPFELSGLEKYKFTEMLCDYELNGRNPDDLYAIARARGILPHGVAGEVAFRNPLPDVKRFAAVVRNVSDGGECPPREVELQIGGIVLSGKIGGIWPRGFVQYRYALIKPSDRLRAWITWCVLNAKPNCEPVAGYLIGRDEKSDAVYCMNDAGICRAYLDDSIGIYMKGMRELVHFFPSTSLAYAAEMLKSGSREAALRKATQSLEGGLYSIGEMQDPYINLCYRKTNPLDEEFERLSMRIYQPMLNGQVRQ